ncbi:hypothetical protein ACO0K3_03590 [Undibacterium sp. Rencai35W]|uniref:hypothetical protein n=1 Tax=Undibacterium sp. Rencai35W TaxID=3413046 RepID=UPI003BF10DB4
MANWWDNDPVSSDKSKEGFWSADEVVPQKKKPETSSGFIDNLKNYGNAVSSALGQGIGGMEAGIGTFLQAPAANTLAAVKGVPAVIDRGLTNLINVVSPGEAALHTDTQEEAQRASQFATESRAENVASKYNVVAKLGKLAQDDGRDLIKRIQADDAVDNPELIRQQQALADAEGFLGNLKAMKDNPLAFTHMMAKSLPDMAVGLGVGRVAATRVLGTSVAAGDMAAARIAASGGDSIAQAAAAKEAMTIVQQKATQSASTAGMLSEAGSSGNSSRESSYNQVSTMPFDKLAESPRFAEILAKVGDKEKAREILANEVADQTPMLSAGLTAAGTLATNKLFGGDSTAKVLSGVEKASLKAVAKDAAQEGVEEVLQGVPQGFSDHTAMLAADPNKKYDLGGEIAQNAMGGIAMGGAGHGGAYAFQKVGEVKQSLADKNSVPAVADVSTDSEVQPAEAPKPTEAEAALMKPKNISALDRVGEIDTELSSVKQRAQAITTENGYGPTFDKEREELAQQVGQLEQERKSITSAWPKAAAGADTSFTTEAGARIGAKYALMESGDLQTSHDENLRANPAYPPELQPRERDRAASSTQISGIVQKLDPARLGLSADAATGAPIVGADGLVESGNARTIALKRIYQANGQKAEDYKSFLTTNAGQFGIDPAQIASMQKPVLVRVRTTPVNRAEFARQANATTVARMSSVEQARSDAARMDILDDLNPDDNGDFTTSRDFIRRFMAKIPQTEVGEMIDGDGKLSPAGYARMRNAVLAKAYGDSPVLLRMTESLDDNLRNVSKALMQVAPQVAKVRESIKEGHLHDADITPDLLGAVEELSRLKDKGKTVKDYMSQSGMFGDKLTPEGHDMLQFLDENIRRPRQMAEFVLRYTEALEAMGHPGQANIFGDNQVPTKGELLTAAKREQHDAQESIAGEGRSQESEVPAGPDNIQRDDARSNEASNQSNDATAGRQGDEVVGKKINKEWTAFAPESGTLGIPRADMPQIKAEHRGAMVNFLKARGINSESEIVPADSLKPTQAEFSPEKVDKAKAYEGGDRSILISSDKHVLDGHHQWMAKRELGEDVKAIRLDAPIHKLLETVKEFPSAETADGSKKEVVDDAVFKSGHGALNYLFGMPADELTSQVKSLSETWANAPKINVVQSVHELPFNAPYDARGAYYQGQVYLVSDNLHGAEDAQMVLFHEALGHAGLRGALGEELAPALRKLALNNRSIAKAAGEWRKENADIRGKRSEDKWLTTSIEEVLADIAGSGRKITGLEKLLSKVQSSLRAIGLDAVANWMERATNAEALTLLSAARKHILSGQETHFYTNAEAQALSRTGDDAIAQHALDEIASIGDAFKYDKSDKDTVEGITKDADANIKVRKLTNIPGETRYEFTLPDETTARMMVRPFNKYGKSIYGYDLDANNEMSNQVDERPGKFPEEAHGKGDVWIDVSLLNEGSGFGTKIYHIASNYAHNTGQVFIGDPAGLSHAAMLRRPEQMLSSALKFGTTEHIAPHPAQIKGNPKNGVAPLDWVYGDHVGNIQKLIDATLQNIDNGGGIGGIEYDKQSGEFVDSSGSRITREDLRGLAEAGLARKVSAGSGTLARYAFLKSALSDQGHQGQTGRKPGELLVRLSGQLRDHVSAVDQNGSGTKEIFYSRIRDDKLTPAERAEKLIQSSARTAAPIDALVKGVTKLTGLDRATTAVYNGAAFILDRYTPEQVKAGFVSDYGVPDAVIDRRAGLSGHMNVQTRKVGNLLDKLSSLTREESRIAYEWMSNSNPQAIAYLEKQLPPESVKVLAEAKNMIDSLSKEAVSLGQLSPEAYERNKMEYLHRSYEKHTLEQDKGEAKRRARAIAIMGDQYKGRGLSESVPMSSIQNTAPEWWNRKLKEGQADKQLKGESFIRLEKHAPSGEGTTPLDGIENRPKGKLQEVVYVPAGEAIPAKYSEWDQAGTYEVQDTKGGNAILWRDFTKQEREKMGEIDEARFAIAKTLHGMIHDVEVGRYMEWIGKKYALAHETQVPGKLIDAKELSLGTMNTVYKPGDWVKIPETKVNDTDAYKYGKLAGKYIPGPIWNDVRQISSGSFKPFGDVYSSILKVWKACKTALSPAVHLNNVMTNFVMADWHDVSASHIHKALKILLAAHDRDGKGMLGTAGNVAARAGMADREAAKEVIGRYQDSGGNIGTWASKELQQDQIQPLLEALEKEAGMDPDSIAAQVGVMNAMQFLLQGELSAAWDAAKGSKPGKAVITEGSTLIDLYQSEDEVFRLAAWLAAKEGGATDMDAGHVSRKSFLDYSINAPWVAGLRATAFPFMAFSYRAIPMMAETVAKRPWKVLKLAMLVGLLNSISYALSGGNEDDERRYLPEEKAGRVWGLVPKLVRMPWNDSHNQPVFLDIRRFIPVGDIVDTGQSNSAIPLPPSVLPGGPMALMGELVLNKSMFTGQAITENTDTAKERVTKTLDYLYKSMTPNLPILPGTHSWDSIVKANSGGTDAFGRELSTGQAILNTVGVKVGSYGQDTLRLNAAKKLQAEMMEIDHNVAKLKREYSRKGMTYDEFVEKARSQQMKKKELAEKFRAQ